MLYNIAKMKGGTTDRRSKRMDHKSAADLPIRVPRCDPTAQKPDAADLPQTDGGPTPWPTSRGF